MYDQTSSNDLYYFKANNMACSSFYNQNELENDDGSNNMKYQSEYLEKMIYFMKENGNNDETDGNSHNDNYEESNNVPNVKIKENNYYNDDKQIDSVVNFEFLTKQFDKSNKYLNSTCILKLLRMPYIIYFFSLGKRRTRNVWILTSSFIIVFI